MTRIGYDFDSQVARQAQNLGAVDRLVSHPRRAAASVDVVILSAQTTEIHDLLELLGKKLKDDAVILDTSSLRAPTVAWATELLPEGRHYIGATPIVEAGALRAGIAEEPPPRPDLFQGGLMALVVPPRTPEGAVALALQVVDAIGATPFFLGPMEQDAVIATTEGLPYLTGIALMHAAANAQNWREIQHLAGPIFATATHSSAIELARKQASPWMLSREIVVHKLDAFVEELQKIRAMLASEDNSELEAYISQAISSREAWIAAREHGDLASFERKPGTPIETPRFLEGKLGDRLRRPPKEPK